MLRDQSSIGWAQPAVCESDFYALKDCFDSRWLSQGTKVQLFEDRVAGISNREHCVAVSSGSAALIAVLIALGATQKSEIVIPTLSFIALPHAITMLGALPVLADVDRRTGVITAETVSPCMSQRTLAVIGVDYSGFANDWTDLAGMCARSGVTLVVDSASSFLASVKGRPAGAFGAAAIFSFHAAKTITTGEGGAIVTDDKQLASSLRQIRSHGEVPGCKYSYDLLGGNFRMTDMAASLGVAQISRKHEILDHRHRIIHEYLSRHGLGQIAMVNYRDSDMVSSGFTFTVLSESRDRIRQGLFDHGVDTRVMWPCIDQQPAYKRYPVKTVGGLSDSRWFSESCLSLPVHAGMSKREVDYISDIVERQLL